MKKLLLLISVAMLFSFSLVDNSISQEERKKAADFLSETRKGVQDATKGLTETQLKFRTAPDRWSVEDCLKHIAITEQMLWAMVEGGLKNPATPEKRSEIKATDEDVIKNLEDRTNKVKTYPSMEPVNTPFTSADEALASFNSDRQKLIDYVNSTGDDLRNHVVPLPFGVYDSYQMILFIGAHSNRHMQQINEVKADPGFPKKGKK